MPDVAYSRDNRFGFTDITVTSEKVYAIYSGHTYRENPRTFQQCRQLLVFDWEGTLLETYALDTPLTHITVDVSENVLYAIGHDLNLSDETSFGQLNQFIDENTQR